MNITCALRVLLAFVIGTTSLAGFTSEAAQNEIRYANGKDPGSDFKCVSSITAATVVAGNGLAKCDFSFGVIGLSDVKYAGTFSSTENYPIDVVCHSEGCLEYSAAVIFTAGLMLIRIPMIKRKNSKAEKTSLRSVIADCQSHYSEMTSLLCKDAKTPDHTGFEKRKLN